MPDLNTNVSADRYPAEEAPPPTPDTAPPAPDTAPPTPNATPPERLAPPDPASADEKPPLNRYGLLDVAPTFSYSKISSTDLSNGSQASLLSNLNYGFRASWRQHWSDRLETGLYFSWMETQFLATSLDKSVQNADNPLSSFGATAAYRLLPGLILEGFAGMQQELIVMASDPVTLRLDRISLPALGADLRIPLLTLDPFTLQVWLGGSLMAPQAMGSYVAELGESYGCGVRLGETISPRWELYGEGSFNELNQPTTLTSQSGQELLFSVGLSYRVGGSLER